MTKVVASNTNNIVKVYSVGLQGPAGAQGASGSSGTFPYTGSAEISGSLDITGSILPGEANTYDLGSADKYWRDIYVSGGSIKFISGSTTSSLSMNSTGELSGNFSGSFSGSLSGSIDSASYASTASYAETAQTASYFSGSISNAISSSYALTASYALNGGAGGSTDTGSLMLTGSVSSNILTFTKGDGSTFNLTVDTGSGGGGSTDTGSLLTTASAANATITFTKGDASTFNVTVNNVGAATSATSASYVNATNVDGTVTAASTSSFLQAFSVYDGNRTVTNSDLPSGIYNNNFGTSGSLAQFIDAVFFPGTSSNNAPVITSVSFSIAEYDASGSTVGTVTASDADADPLTFSVQAGYTDDYFRISSAGVITANVLMSASLNTNTSQGYSASLFPIQVTDGTDTTTGNIYIRVIPNAAPTFRQGSVGGSIITTFTSSLDESSQTGSKGVIYFADTEGHTLTITTGSVSPSGYFDLEISSSNSLVRVVQTTSSLVLATGSYTFSITASDQYYPSPDPDSIAYLEGVIIVADNLAPTINNQTLSGVTESASSGTSAGTVTVNDVEGDVTTIVRFALLGLSLDGTPIATGSYSGSSFSDPTENPFQINSSTGEVTLKSSVYLNSDIINAYTYSVGAIDNFNSSTGSGIITIPIADDANPSLNTNGTLPPLYRTFYAIESAVSGNLVYTSGSGYSGTQTAFSSNQSVTWTVSSSGLFSVNTSGQLSLNSNISESYSSGSTLAGSITASNSFGTTTQTTFIVKVTTNVAPTLTINAVTTNLTSSNSTSGSNILTITASDSQAVDTITSVSIYGGDSDKFNLIETTTPPASTRRFLVQPTASLSTGSYNITSSTIDSYGKTATSSISFDIVESAVQPSVYVYASSYGASAPIPANYLAIFNQVTNSLANGTLGRESITNLPAGLMTLVGSGSTDNLLTLLGSSGTLGAVNPTEGDAGNHLMYIIYPSASVLEGQPQSMTDSFGGSTVGEYVLYYYTDASDKGIVGSQLNNFTLSTGYTGSDGVIRTDQTNWTILGCNNSKFSSTSTTFYIVPSSGSAPA